MRVDAGDDYLVRTRRILEELRLPQRLHFGLCLEISIEAAHQLRCIVHFPQARNSRRRPSVDERSGEADQFIAARDRLLQPKPADFSIFTHGQNSPR